MSLITVGFFGLSETCWYSLETKTEIRPGITRTTHFDSITQRRQKCMSLFDFEKWDCGDLQITFSPIGWCVRVCVFDLHA